MRTKIVIEQTLAGLWFWRVTFPKESGIDSLSSPSFNTRHEVEEDLWNALCDRKFDHEYPLDISVKDSNFKGFENE